MEHVVKYAVLRATPDSRRGERVNIGLIAFLSDRIDVRFSELTKLNVLTGEDWDSYASMYRETAQKAFQKGLSAEETLKSIEMLDEIVAPTNLGWFSATANEDYEASISAILNELVVKPKKAVPMLPALAPQTRINTEMAKSFRELRVLAKKDESLRTKKIVRDYTVSKKEELKVDFAWRNGKLNCAATLDLRIHTSLGTAALKALALDKARREYGGDKKVNRIGVYAVDPGHKEEHKSQIAILADYSNKTFNWGDTAGRKLFLRYMADNMDFPFFNQTDI
jgi:hypothetical protein